MRTSGVFTRCPHAMTAAKFVRRIFYAVGTRLVHFATTTLIYVFVTGRTLPPGAALTVVLTRTITKVCACAVTAAGIRRAIVLVFGAGGAFPPRSARARECVRLLARVRAFASVGTRLRETVVHILVTKLACKSAPLIAYAHGATKPIFALSVHTFGSI